MGQEFIRFGEELRRRRLAADLSLADLARRVHYSKGHLSKVERGIKVPGRRLARLCDTALDAGGELAILIPEEDSEAAPPGGNGGEEDVWLMCLSSHGRSWFQPVSRRQVMSVGAASLAGMSISGSVFRYGSDDGSLLGVFRSVFDHYRRLGQAVDSRLIVPALIAQTHTLLDLSRNTGPRMRPALLRLGSRYAEYIGWLIQETGNDEAAMWWTRHAVNLAAAGGDHSLAAYGLVRRALVTLYRGDSRQTVQLARHAQVDGIPPQIRGLAAEREAQGHALAGDDDSCMRSLERARELFARGTQDSDAPVIGTTNLPDPAEMIKGWCLYDLGHPRAATEVLDRQLADVHAGAVRTRVRYGARRALAYASAGEIDHACHLTRELLSDAVAVGSATIAADFGDLAHTLSRHPKVSSVRDLSPELGAALRSIIP